MTESKDRSLQKSSFIIGIIIANMFYFFTHEYLLYLQWVPQSFERLEFFHVKKSCKIYCYGNKMHQNVQKMILSRGLELKLSLL